MRPRLLVIGGGYLGCGVARRLDAEMDVTLIEAKDSFVHTPAMIRSLIEPGLTDRAIIPYDRLLARGRVIHARASKVDADRVELDNGQRIEGDLILIATGSHHMDFLKPEGSSVAEFRVKHSEIAARIRQARHIAVVGAGPAGIEMAGEIASARLGKQITLIATAQQLMPEYPRRLGRLLGRKLAAMGVTILAGRAQLSSVQGADSLMLEDGRTVSADLILPAIGSLARNDLLATLPGASVTANGRMQTDAWLRPSDYSRVFAGGDIAATGDSMTIVATMRQIPFLVKTLRHVAGGGDIRKRPPYRPWTNAPILLSLDPKMGGSFLPVPAPFTSLGVVGDVLTRQLKGNDLFIQKYRKLLRQS